MTTKTETKKAEAKKPADLFADWMTVPSFDAKGVFEFQRKNVEAAVEANKIVFEGMKSAAQKQIDLAKDSMAEINEVATTAVNSKTPENGATKFADLSQAMIQNNIKVAREVTDVMVDAGQKAVTVLQERVSEGSEEIRAAAQH